MELLFTEIIKIFLRLRRNENVSILKQETSWLSHDVSCKMQYNPQHSKHPLRIPDIYSVPPDTQVL